MGYKMTKMNPGHAFTANLITGIMVFGVSKVGGPVSTAHVSCGSIFGIGAVNKSLNMKMIGHILLAWVTTLPLGFILGATLMSLI
jgi:PiT family inorganic phosphate transporter